MDSDHFIVGLSQRADPRGSIACQVVAKDAAGHRKVLTRTPALPPAATAQWNIDVSLPADCAKLRLVVDDAGDGNACDHANWVNAGFID